MILDNTRFQELKANVEITKEGDHFLFESKFRQQEVTFTCDEEGNNFDFEEDFYYKKRGDVIKIELTPEQEMELTDEAKREVLKSISEQENQLNEAHYWEMRGGYDAYQDRGISIQNFL